ncbi:hypothetical protein BDW71DRAFT_210927 [Aspergillus fruticulosus]
MPRRTRPVEYDDIIDDMEEVYPNRMKGEVLIDRNVRYGHGQGHRMPRAPGPPPAPVAEILPDRRHRRGRSKPEYPHEDLEYLRDDVLAAERRARLDLDAYRAEEARKYREERHGIRESRPRPQPRVRGRRRSKISDIEQVYFSHDDSDHGTTESESDEMDEFIETKRSISRNDLDARKEALPRSKSLKEEKRVRQSIYGEDVYPKGSRSLEEYVRDSKGSRHDIVPRQRHRSHYHIDLTEDKTPESDESVDVVPTRGRQGVVRRNHVEQRYSARRRVTSSSSSSPESAGSSEEELPKVPLPIPVPPLYKESSRRHKPLGHVPVRQVPRPPSPPSPPNLPRVPSLETVLNEREVRQRRKMEKAAKEEIEIGSRSRESLQLPSEPPARRKKGKSIAIVEEPEAAGHRELLVEEERVNPRVTYKERGFIEEEYPPEPQPMRSSPHSDSMDDWAIIQVPSSRLKYSPEREPPAVDVREEPSHARRRDRPPKLAVDEIREPKHKGDTARGKVGPRYIGVKDRRDRLWTEITKDLVVREAIERAGYEYEEFDSFYYIFSYLHPDEVSALVEDSDTIRRARRRRIKEIQRERASLPPSSRRSPNKSAPLLAERPPSPPAPPSPPRQHRQDRREERRKRDREQERERVPVREEDIAIEESGHWRARPGRW